MEKTWMFFVGSLNKSRVLEKFQAYIKDQKPAHIMGTCYIDPVGYPCATVEGNDEIEGLLVLLSGPSLVAHLMDEFYGFSRLAPERSLFLRMNCLARPQDGSEPQAVETYFLNPNRVSSAYHLVPGGDWNTYLALNPPLTDKISSRQKEYIVKLGQSSGREIVPIELDLYRQLLGLDLIVDKGRRLALTKLGREVYKHFS